MSDLAAVRERVERALDAGHALATEALGLLVKVDQLQAENARLREALRAYIKAQGRMLTRWAEADEGVKKQLWRDLHMCEAPARDALEGRADG